MEIHEKVQSEMVYEKELISTYFQSEKRNEHFSYKTNLLKSQTNIKQSLGGDPSWCLYEKQDKINLSFYRQI